MTGTQLMRLGITDDRGPISVGIWRRIVLQMWTFTRLYAMIALSCEGGVSWHRQTSTSSRFFVALVFC